MVAGPVQSFTKDNIKARWTERYTSDAINKKFVGIPRGCYLGFIPSPTGLVLSLKPDKSLSFSNFSGTFTEGQTITGGTSGATATVRVVSLNYILIDTIFGGPFVAGETITTGTGSATVEHFGEEDISLARVVSSSALAAGRSEHMIDVITADTVNIDFTGFADGIYYVILTASYEVGQTTIGNIITRTTPPPSGPQEVLICVVTKIGVTLTAAATTPTTRHDPHAFEGTRIGFMPGGSVEALQQAIAATEEVVASRQLSDGTTAPVFDPISPQTTGLPQRLNTDLSNTAMAARLGKRLSMTRGNDFTLAGAAVSKNVSSAFGTRNRDFEPFRDLSPSTGIGVPANIEVAIEPDGSDLVQLNVSGVVGTFTVGLQITGGTSGASAIIKSVVGTAIGLSDLDGTFFTGETITQAAPVATATVDSTSDLVGAITNTSGSVTKENICNLVDKATSRRPVDTDGYVVFARLVYGPGGLSSPGQHTLTAGQQVNFTASTTTIVVSSGTITGPEEIDIGDIFEGDDGRFYEIEKINGSTASPAPATSIVNMDTPVAKDYVGPTAVGVGSLRRRRFVLEFRRVVAGVEGSATLPAGDYEFYFPTWFKIGRSNTNDVAAAAAPGNALVNDGATVDVTRGVGSNDDRVGQVFGDASTVIGAANTVRRPRIEIVNGTAISVQVADNGDRLTFTITNTSPSIGGSPFPGLNTLAGNVVADASPALPGTTGLAADAGHRHALSSLYKIRTKIGTSNPLGAAFDVFPDFTPRVAIYVTQQASVGIAVGIAVGAGASDQAYVRMSGNSGNVSVFETGFVNGDGGEKWTCDSFTSASVNITRSGTAGTAPGCFAVIIGDNLPA